MSETVERKPNNKKRLLGAVLLALGALLLVGQIVMAIAGAVVYHAAGRRSDQPVVVVEEIAAVQAERDAEAVAREAERMAAQAERDAEAAAREAEIIAAQAEREAEAAAREAERMAEQIEREAERMAEQAERDFGGYVYTVEVERQSPFFFHPFRSFRPYRGPSLIPLALIVFGVYMVLKQRRAAAPVPQTGPEADHGPAV